MKNKNAFEDNGEQYKKELLDCLREKRGVFFTGSGISVESGIAKVENVLKHTCHKFLAEFEDDYSLVPKDSSLKDYKKVSRTDYICKVIQPELFYSVLLEHTETNHVLEMWNCLKQDHYTSFYCPQPNIIHYFIVAYSHFAKVPIFTMNYDKMFEEACKNLGLPYHVYAGNAPDTSCESEVLICKLHGNLRENVGNKVTSKDIATTMPEISKENPGCRDFIKETLKTHDMCIWGYSGRDRDYFPFLQKAKTEIEEEAEEAKRECEKKAERKVDSPNFRFFWTIGNPKNSSVDKITEEKASSLDNVRKLTGYPSDMKNELMDVLSSVCGDNVMVQHILKLTESTAINTEAKERFLKEIESNIDAKDLHFNKDICWTLLMQRTGQNKMLGEMVKKLLEQDKEHPMLLTNREKIILLKARITSAREHADFSQYRQLAKELKRVAKQLPLSDDKRCECLETAKVEYISSLQMCVPSGINLKIPLLRRKYGLLLLARIGFAFLNFRYRPKKKLYQKIPFLVQKCKIRSLAIDCKVPLLKDRTLKQLEDLRHEAYTIGNIAALDGVKKYHDRLVPPDTDESEKTAKNPEETTTDPNALSIMYRDTDPEKSLYYAKQNDNTLNIIKAIFSMKFCINNGADIIISDEDKRLLFESIQIVTPKSLRKTLLIIGKREGLILDDGE